MSASARRKGHQFERDCVNSLKDALGIDCKRVLDQYREGELGDVVLEPFVLECKRYADKSEPLTAWWDQAWAAGENMNLIPVLVWKSDRRPIHCVVPLNTINQNIPFRKEYSADLTWDNLMLIMREKLNEETAPA